MLWYDLETPEGEGDLRQEAQVSSQLTGASEGSGPLPGPPRTPGSFEPKHEDGELGQGRSCFSRECCGPVEQWSGSPTLSSPVRKSQAFWGN